MGLSHSTALFGEPDPNIPDDQANGTTLFGNWSVGFQNANQLFDIAAARSTLDGPPNLRTGDDTYTLNPTAAF